MMPSKAFLKLSKALYGPPVNAISVGLELPLDLEFQGEVKQISVPVHRWSLANHSYSNGNTTHEFPQSTCPVKRWGSFNVDTKLRQCRDGSTGVAQAAVVVHPDAQIVRACFYPHVIIYHKGGYRRCKKNHPRAK